MLREPVPVDDDETIFRRIPVKAGWYDGSSLSPQAFHPRPDEKTGISVYRARFKSITDAARGQSSEGYYVAVLNVGELRKRGISVVPRPEVPEGYDEAHAELPDLNAENRRSNEVIERKAILVELALQRPIEGVFK